MKYSWGKRSAEMGGEENENGGTYEIPVITGYCLAWTSRVSHDLAANVEAAGMRQDNGLFLVRVGERPWIRCRRLLLSQTQEREGQNESSSRSVQLGHDG